MYINHVESSSLTHVAGFGTAATALARSWNHDPDSLPFAQNIKTHTLIHLVQDGLFLDALQAEASEAAQAQSAAEEHGEEVRERLRDSMKHKRRYIIGSDHGPHYAVHDDRDDSPMDEGVDVDGSPRANGNGIVIDVLAPGRKRKRRSHLHGPGDLMDIDGTNGAHTPQGDLDADGEDDVEHEVEEIEQLTSTLEIGDSKGVMKEDEVINLSANKKIIKLERPWTALKHLSWSSEPGVLALAGDGLLEMHIFADPEPPDGAPPTPQSLKGSLTRNNWNSKRLIEECQITAVCWVSRETLAIGLLEGAGEQMAGRLITATADDDGEGTICNELHMIPTAMVLALAYHEALNLLLCIESTDIGSAIRIYCKDEHGAQFERVANTYANEIVYDCAWLAPESSSQRDFVLCSHGKIGLFRVEEQNVAEAEKVNGNQPPHRAGSRKIKEHWIPSNGQWEKIVVSPDGLTIAVHRPGFSEIAITTGKLSEPETVKLEQLQLEDEAITSLAFQSRPSYAAPDSPLFLAIATDAGRVHLFNYGTNSMEVTSKPIHTLSVHALALAFSPSGTQLAVGGLDYILLFSISPSDSSLSLTAHWRPQPEDDWVRAVKLEGVNGDGMFHGEENCKLGWDKEGRRVGWAVGNMVCVISVGGSSST